MIRKTDEICEKSWDVVDGGRDRPARVEFDAYGDVVKNVFPKGKPEEKVSTYEVVGGLSVSSTDALMRKTAFEHDAHGNVTKITRLAGTAKAVSSTTTWNTALGRPLTETDENNNTTKFEYDARGNLVKAVDANLAFTIRMAGPSLLWNVRPNGQNCATVYAFEIGMINAVR